MGFEFKDVSAQFLLAAGDMALLYDGVGSNVIKLISCWRSDEMLHYLYV